MNKTPLLPADREETLHNLAAKIAEQYPNYLQSQLIQPKEYPNEWKDHPIYLYCPLPACAEQQEDYHAVQMAERFLQLFDFFSINPNSSGAFAQLDMVLAQKHVPLFHINRLEDEKSRKDGKAFIYYLEVRMIKHHYGLKDVKKAICYWLTLNHHTQKGVDDNLPSKTTDYYAVNKGHRILIDARKSLNLPEKEEQEILDTHLFKSFSKELEPIRQLLKSTLNQ